MTHESLNLGEWLWGKWQKWLQILYCKV